MIVIVLVCCVEVWLGGEFFVLVVGVCDVCLCVVFGVAVFFCCGVVLFVGC